MKLNVAWCCLEVYWNETGLACVASVSAGFGSKERPRNGIFGVLTARKIGQEPKRERWGWGRGRKETFPSFLPLPLPPLLLAPFFAL